jgi:hypothetical protein
MRGKADYWKFVKSGSYALPRRAWEQGQKSGSYALPRRAWARGQSLVAMHYHAERGHEGKVW